MIFTQYSKLFTNLSDSYYKYDLSYPPSQTKSGKACPRALALAFQSQQCCSLFLLKSYGAETQRYPLF